MRTAQELEERYTDSFKWTISPESLNTILEILYYHRMLDCDNLSRGDFED